MFTEGFHGRGREEGGREEGGGSEEGGEGPEWQTKGFGMVPTDNPGFN